MADRHAIGLSQQANVDGVVVNFGYIANDIEYLIDIFRGEFEGFGGALIFEKFLPVGNGELIRAIGQIAGQFKMDGMTASAARKGR